MLGKTAIGKYRILRSLGSGSNGEVFLAEPLRYPNSRVVVKRVHDHVVAHTKFRQLFEVENEGELPGQGVIDIPEM